MRRAWSCDVLGPDRRQCVVVKRMCVAAPRPGCVLTAHGCQRLGWHFYTLQNVWPTVELIDAARVLRLESIVPDWRDLEERCGVNASPSKNPHTPDELRRGAIERWGGGRAGEEGIETA